MVDYEYQRDTFVVARVCEQSRGTDTLLDRAYYLDQAYYDEHIVLVIKKHFDPDADIEALWKGVLADKPTVVEKSSADGKHYTGGEQKDQADEVS